MYQKLFDAIELNKDLILNAEDHIKHNPELGFREWKTHAYLKERFEELGYKLNEIGNIPGFYTDVDTGIPGPKIVIFGELDGLPCKGHPLADKETGAAHACGHNQQCAALLGVAAGLKAEGALDGMCGSIRLFAVPAEEGVDAAYRQILKENNTVKYFSGKPEILYRGLLDDVDIAMMIHATTSKLKISSPRGSNGNVRKKATFIGKAAHAGSKPHDGINALYAATSALSVANALRETFREKDYIRMHPIISKGGDAVNAIPDEIVCENMIRGANYDKVADINRKVNRAFAGTAASMGCRVYFEDFVGSAPRYNDENLREAFHQVSKQFFKEEEMNFNQKWAASCSDLGDVSCVIPSVQANIYGSKGSGHGVDYEIFDPYTSCVIGAKILAGVAKYLLVNDAAYAKKVISESKLPYSSKEELFKVKDSMNSSFEGVIYNDDGTITLNC